MSFELNTPVDIKPNSRWLNTTITCIACDTPVTYIGTIDSNRSAADAFANKRIFSKTGMPIPYHQCNSCNLVFSNYFEYWSEEDFNRFIYNSDYNLIDPPFELERPRSNALWLNKCIKAGTFRKNPSILDYGAGEGRFLQELEKLGHLDLAGLDKYSRFSRGDLKKKYDIVTCFEVLEHSLDPKKIINECIGSLNENGTFIFSTLLLPRSTRTDVLSWWYIAPRNGHICIHTEQSLKNITPPRFTLNCSSFRDIHTITRSDRSTHFLEAIFSQTRSPYLPEEKVLCGN